MNFIHWIGKINRSNYWLSTEQLIESGTWMHSQFEALKQFLIPNSVPKVKSSSKCHDFKIMTFLALSGNLALSSSFADFKVNTPKLQPFWHLRNQDFPFKFSLIPETFACRVNVDLSSN